MSGTPRRSCDSDSDEEFPTVHYQKVERPATPHPDRSPVASRRSSIKPRKLELLAEENHLDSVQKFAMASNFKQPHFEALKCSGENWDDWRTNMTAHLKVADLEIEPAQIYFALSEAEKARDKNALERLISYLDAANKRLVQDAKTFNDAMALLKAQHMPATVTNVMAVTVKIYSTRMLENANIKEHLQVFDKLFLRLEDMNRKLDEKGKVIAVLASLPPSYRHLVASFNQKTDNEVTLANVKKLLLTYGDQGIENFEANFGMSARVIRCQLCNLEGHVASSCPQLGIASETSLRGGVGNNSVHQQFHQN